ncbi:hypothetical protein HK405_000326, partial [Cladochytrium tenue]
MAKSSTPLSASLEEDLLGLLDARLTPRSSRRSPVASSEVDLRAVLLSSDLFADDDRSSSNRPRNDQHTAA